MIRWLRSLLVPAGLGFGLLMLVGLLGASLVAVREAAALHPMLGWAVGLLAGLGFVLLVAWPVAGVLSLPRASTPPVEHSGAAWKRYVRRYARRLRHNATLRDGYEHYSELCAAADADSSTEQLEGQIESAIAFLDERARELVAGHAAAVFAATAISQSGRLDAIVVLSAQLRTVREIARLYYQRPRPLELWRLYANVGAAVFLAGEIQDSELLAVLGAPVGAAVTGMLPVQGTDPLVSLLVNSLLDGSANGFLTLRIGAVARRYCGLRPDPRREAVAASASLEAAGMLAATVSTGAARIARATRKLVVRGAVESTTKVAQSVAGASTDALGRVASLLDRTARRIGREARRPPLWVVQESAKFWDAVSDTVRRGSDDTEDAPPA